MVATTWKNKDAWKIVWYCYTHMKLHDTHIACKYTSETSRFTSNSACVYFKIKDGNSKIFRKHNYERTRCGADPVKQRRKQDIFPDAKYNQ